LRNATLQLYIIPFEFVGIVKITMRTGTALITYSNN